MRRRRRVSGSGFEVETASIIPSSFILSEHDAWFTKRLPQSKDPYERIHKLMNPRRHVSCSRPRRLPLHQLSIAQQANPGRAEPTSPIKPSSQQKIKAAVGGLPSFLETNTGYRGFLCTGGFLVDAGAALVKSAPFSMTITKGLGV